MPAKDFTATRKTASLTAQEIGDAILRWIGARKHSTRFIHYRIEHASILLPEILSATLSSAITEAPVGNLFAETKEELNETSYTLSKDEFFRAITLVDDLSLGRTYEGNRVVSLSARLPDQIRVKLGYRSKFSRNLAIHVFDGTLQD
jgi:hypothetical protein